LEQTNAIPSEHVIPPGTQVIIERLSAALRKLTISASQSLGSDCAAHAYLSQRVLADEGIHTRVVIGAAAWRIGPGDGDVISHVPQTNGVQVALQPKAFPYHAWLETDTHIIDFSTHTLGLKASQLDAMDGGHTTVAWCPDFLLLAREDVKSYRDVAQAPREGVAFYREIPALLGLMIARGFIDEANEEDLYVLRMIYRNPDIHVIGVEDVVLPVM